MDDAPKNLYKYLPPDRASDVLGKLLIRFSQVSVMNDKEEFKPPIKGLAARSRVEQVIRERYEVRFPGSIQRIEKSLPPQEAAQLIQESISKCADKAELNLVKSIETIYKINNENFGILSLSEDATNTRMWKRYADCGRGFLIELDHHHSWFWDKKEERDDLRHLRRVNYASSRPPAYLFETTGQDYLYTKEKKWEHEKEWRIIRNFNDAACKIGKDNTGTDILLFAIPPNCILSVVVGHKASHESVRQMRGTVAANPSLSHVCFRAAILKDDGSVEIGLPGKQLVQF
ncbi:MAG: DUF2971 domain-containing protein [Candidatus Korobacteraceae bacterium]